MQTDDMKLLLERFSNLRAGEQSFLLRQTDSVSVELTLAERDFIVKCLRDRAPANVWRPSPAITPQVTEA